MKEMLLTFNSFFGIFIFLKEINTKIIEIIHTLFGWHLLMLHCCSSLTLYYASEKC